MSFPKLASDLGEFKILDDIVTVRAADEEQVPLLAYPMPGKGVADFELFTGKVLDRFIDQAAKEYIRRGCAPGQDKVIAISGPSDLDYVVSFFALSRLGYTILLLSPRLAPPAIANLLKMTDCDTIVHPDLSILISNFKQVERELPSLKMIAMAQRCLYDKPEISSEPRFARDVDKDEERKKVAVICHSSGSTGLPKPIYQPHNRFIATQYNKESTREFGTFPLYHSWGNKVSVNVMWMRKTMYLHSATLPITANGLVEVMRKVRPSVLHAVPYALKLLAESKEGIEEMARCSEVIFSGSQCPDSLGDYLTSQGVNLGTLFGATEYGSLGASRGRAPGDLSWDYIRIPPWVRPHVQMKPIGNNTYESIILSSNPSLVTSNSDDPPGSYHSKDIFAPHPTIPDAWKYLGRLDDRITLINGEKVLPTPIEGRVKHEVLIREAVVFGIEKSIPGLLVIRSEAAREMSDKEFVDAIWPAIQDANANAEGFSQIGREMILALPAGIEYPLTDKGSIIRAQVYRKFAEEIEEVYRKFEDAEQGTLELEGPELENYLMGLFTNSLGIQLSSPEADFFAAGMDSLKSIQARGLILKELSMGGNAKKLGQNVVFECGNVARLAKKLNAIKKGEEMTSEDTLAAMAASIEKYSNLEPHTPGVTTVSASVVVLTGATGSLGAHILSQLLTRPDVSKIYCLVRGPNPHTRITESLHKRGLSSILPSPKIIPLTSDLSHPSLNLPPTTFRTLQNETTHIIHSAWAVNFNVGFSSFDQDITGVHNLLQLSLSVPTSNPARFFFCSSIAAALGAPRPAVIPESLVDISQCSSGGYGRSKWVAENIISNASEKYGADAHILRIGQIVGDAKLGIWNDTEAIPLMIRSALTLKMLPELDMTCSWLPIDTLATSILELSFPPSFANPAKQQQTLYNLLSPHRFHWTTTLLPLLQASGLHFTPVAFSVWLAKLKESATSTIAPVENNPAVKLTEYFERTYGDGSPKGGITFEIGRAQRDSVALRETPDLVKEGYIGKFVGAWLERWEEV